MHERAGVAERYRCKEQRLKRWNYKYLESTVQGNGGCGKKAEKEESESKVEWIEKISRHDLRQKDICKSEKEYTRRQ